MLWRYQPFSFNTLLAPLELRLESYSVFDPFKEEGAY